MTRLRVTAGPYEFEAVLEEQVAPKTCQVFMGLLPYRERIIHVRWSGEGCWIPLGDTDFGLNFENATSYPAPGQFLLYPGGYSETELLLAYGSVCFASKMGQLAGNHFLTIVKGQENLVALGKMTLWEGAQDITFERL
jgi:acyl CoA:acetate/3-ketoacid CoA transferase